MAGRSKSSIYTREIHAKHLRGELAARHVTEVVNRGGMSKDDLRLIDTSGIVIKKCPPGKKKPRKRRTF